MPIFRVLVAIAFSIPLANFATAQDQSSGKMMDKKAEMSDAAYTAQAISAAPKALAKEAGVIRMDADGQMKTLRESKNGFTCMIIATDKMCNDANSMEFFGAMVKGETPTDKVGISYMLAGDQGASNTDPKATKKTADNHWVVTGPHIMVTGTASKSLGYPETADADPSKPYMMWAGTPYEHVMIPVGDRKAMPRTAMAEKK